SARLPEARRGRHGRPHGRSLRRPSFQRKNALRKGLTKKNSGKTKKRAYLLGKSGPLFRFSNFPPHLSAGGTLPPRRFFFFHICLHLPAAVTFRSRGFAPSSGAARS